MEEILKSQLSWHSKSMQGCLYAAYAFKNDREGTKLHQVIIKDSVNEGLILKIKKIIDESIIDKDVNYVSILIPRIKNLDSLVLFISLLKTHTNWIVIDDEVYRNKRIVKIRVPFNDLDENEIISWMLFFAPLDFLPPTRQAPFFEMVLPTKAKRFLKEKYNRFSLTQELNNSIDRGTSINDAHLADIYIKDITDNPNRDEKLWSGSSKRKRELLTEKNKIEFDDTLAKAKVTISYPINE